MRTLRPLHFSAELIFRHWEHWTYWLVLEQVLIQAGSIFSRMWFSSYWNSKYCDVPSSSFLWIWFTQSPTVGTLSSWQLTAALTGTALSPQDHLAQSYTSSQKASHRQQHAEIGRQSPGPLRLNLEHSERLLSCHILNSIVWGLSCKSASPAQAYHPHFLKVMTPESPCPQPHPAMHLGISVSIAEESNLSIRSGSRKQTVRGIVETDHSLAGWQWGPHHSR